MTGETRRRRRLLVLLLAVLLVGGGAYVVLERRDGGGAPGGGADASGRGARAAVPPPPEGLAGPGSWVESRVGADGTVEVQQWIRSAVPVERLQLTTADPDAFPGTVESTGVRVSTFDGARLAARGAVGTRTSNVRLRNPATEIYLRYSIAGDTLSDETSTIAGRSVARVLAMDVVFEGQDGPTVRVVGGPGSTVLNAGCLSPAAGLDAPPRPCGAPRGDGGWQVELDGEQRQDRVIAQLEATG